MCVIPSQNSEDRPEGPLRTIAKRWVLALIACPHQALLYRDFTLAAPSGNHSGSGHNLPYIPPRPNRDTIYSPGTILDRIFPSSWLATISALVVY